MIEYDQVLGTELFLRTCSWLPRNLALASGAGHSPAAQQLPSACPHSHAAGQREDGNEHGGRRHLKLGLV